MGVFFRSHNGFLIASGCGCGQQALVRITNTKLDGEVLLKGSNERTGELLDGGSLGKEFGRASHLPLKKGRVRQPRDPREDISIAGDRHGTVLQETASDTALCATGNLSPLDHQLVPGRRQKAGSVVPVDSGAGPFGVGREYGRNPEAVITQTQDLGNALVVSVDGVSKVNGIIGNYGIR